MALTKNVLVEIIQDKMGCKKQEAIDYVEKIIDLMKDTLGSGERILVSGFGSFDVKDKKPRRGRNPATGDSLMLDARRVVVFKTSSNLRNAINK